MRLLADRLDACRAGSCERGADVVARMRRTIIAAMDAVAGRPARRVFVAEWLDPPFAAGHWVPEMVDLAGGEDVLGRAGRPSYATTWDAVAAEQPELIVVAPCGFDRVRAERARRPASSCRRRTVCVDANAYFSRPAPRIAEGVAQLAEHPARGAGRQPAAPGVSRVSCATHSMWCVCGNMSTGCTALQPVAAVDELACVRRQRGRVARRRRRCRSGASSITRRTARGVSPARGGSTKTTLGPLGTRSSSGRSSLGDVALDELRVGDAVSGGVLAGAGDRLAEISTPTTRRRRRAPAGRSRRRRSRGPRRRRRGAGRA